MRVLVACEFSGVVRDAFRARGHEALSCDLLPSEAGEPHYQGDVLELIAAQSFDLMIAHPPCTHLAVSGAAWFGTKADLQREALAFVRALMDAPVKQIAIENPVSIISSHIRQPDQIIQPYQFGHGDMKTTCLWLKHLPHLQPTRYVAPEYVTLDDGRRYPKWSYDTFKLPAKIRAHARSRTFTGIAEAMAAQWGDADYSACLQPSLFPATPTEAR